MTVSKFVEGVNGVSLRGIAGGIVQAIAAGTIVACAEGAPKAARAHAWTVTAEPALRIGVAEGSPALELHRAGDAVRLADGRIVIANTGTSELRIFDSTGSHLRTIGRRGNGPGEYQGALALTVVGADSLVVHDGGNGRFTILGDAGEYAGTLAIGDERFPWDDWLTGNTLVAGVRDFRLRPCVATVLAQVAQEDPRALRRAILDDSGALWVRTIGAPADREWSIYELTGAMIGAVTLPAPLEPFQIGRDFVLGRTLDADGVERIALYRFAPGARRGRRNCELRFADEERAPMPELRADLMNAVVAQEAWFADHMAYAAHADSLDWSSESGASLVVVATSSGGWMGILRPGGAGEPACAIAVGDVTPAGWLEGAPMCAENPSPR
ncbi:MAG TPA: 6-bladed beta-propeller [Gemmatimonadales bacterium]